MSSEEKYEPGGTSFDDKHLEGGAPKAAAEGYVVTADDRHHFDQSDLDQVQRRLKQRHVQMFVSFAYNYAFIAHHIHRPPWVIDKYRIAVRAFCSPFANFCP